MKSLSKHMEVKSSYYNLGTREKLKELDKIIFWTQDELVRMYKRNMKTKEEV